MLDKFSNMFHSSSHEKTVYNKDKEIDLSKFTDMNDEFQLVSQYLSESLPLKIKLPFKGTNLRIVQGDKYYIFVSREGRLAVIDSKEKKILRDVTISKNDIWALELSKDENFIFVSGIDPTIRMCSYETLRTLKTFEGHTGDVNSILSSADSRWIFSCSDDRSVRIWSLNDNQEANKILYTHEDIVYSMALSDNNTYLVTGGRDSKIMVYELAWEGPNENGKIIQVLQMPNDVWAVKISSKDKLIAGGDAFGNIYVWKLPQWDSPVKFSEPQRIRSIDFSKDEKFMVTAGVNKKVVIWNLHSKTEPFEFPGHEDMIKSAIFTHDQQFIVSLADDKLVYRWKVPFFEKEIEMETPQDLKALYGIDEYVIGISSKSISKWDNKGKIVKMLDLNGISTDFIKSDDNFLYFYSEIGTEGKKIKYQFKECNLSTLEFTKDYSVLAGKITSVGISANRKFLCLGEKFKIRTFLITSEGIVFYDSRVYFDKEIILLRLTPDNSLLFARPQGGQSMKLLDLAKTKDHTERNIVAEFSMFPYKKMIDLVCTRDSSKAIMFTEEEVVVWSISQHCILKTVQSEMPLKSISLSNVFEYFFFQSNEGLQIWRFKDFNFITYIELPKLQIFTFSDSEKKISYYDGESLISEDSPLYSKHVKIIGNGVSEKQKDFFKYANEIIVGKSVDYEDHYKFWMIMPFMISIQHFYAYYDYNEYLKLAYLPGIAYCKAEDAEEKEKLRSEGNAPFSVSVNKHTPLSVSVKQAYHGCCKTCLKVVRKRWENDPYSMIFISDSLTDLNFMGLDGLSKLYHFAIKSSFLKGLPKFCKSTKLPIIMPSYHIETDVESMLGKKADISDGNSIVFEQSYFKFNMSLGSSDGMKFMESLLDCPNELIYETPFIQLILQEKWKKVRYLMYFQALLYVGFMVTLAYHSTKALNDGTFLIVPSVINGLLLLYELINLFANGLSYFGDPWNFVDLTRSFLFILYTILIWTGYFVTDTNFLALIVLVTWVRGVTYFRIFGPTRYLINLLFEVFTDIPSFLMIFFYTIIAFSFIFFALNTDPTKQYFDILTFTYSTSLGNSAESGGQLEWLFYIMITLFNFIIMLNLLISILSDTYGRVQDNQIVADSQELANMILEIESILFWRRNLNDKQYFHICREEAEQSNSNLAVMKEFRKMNQLCSEYQDMIRDGLIEYDRTNLEVEAKNKEFSEIISSIEKKFNLNTKF